MIIVMHTTLDLIQKRHGITFPVTAIKEFKETYVILTETNDKS